ncbi:MAG: acetyl-CoA C-acyltransferase [Gemmataceae bacterium]
MDTFIVGAVRTPIGKFLGGLGDYPAPKLGGLVVAEALRRAGVAPADVNEVILGQVVQAGAGQAPARQAALAAGLPPTIAALTINKVCGSGLKAVMLAAQSIRAGDAEIVVAGGMESMSRAPFLLPNIRAGYKYGDQTTVDSLIHDGLWCSFENWAMGCAADFIAEKAGLTRAEQDLYSARSHQRAAAAQTSGAFNAEILPIPGLKKGAEAITKDEGIRADSTAEGLARLKPAFAPTGTVTAGNASQLSDGAAALVVASAAAIEKYSLKPLARIVASATAGVHPKEIFRAPVPAIEQVCAKAGLKLSQMDHIELNEAFAAQVLACQRELPAMTDANLNPLGGGVALGHPIGASGARVLVTLVHALHAQKQRFGLASLCLGGGNAVAMIVERV